MGLLAWVGFAAGLVEVEGAMSCPTPAEVAARLVPLLPAGEGRDRARIEDLGGALRVELRGPAGDLLAAQRLLAVASCEDRAAVVAVVIAAWEAVLRPGVVPAPPPLPIPSLRRVHFEAAAGGMISLAGSAAAPGGTLEVSLAARVAGRGFGARLALLGVAARDLPLGSGRASWRREAAALGPRYRFAPGRWRIDLHAEAVPAWVLVEGIDFPINRSRMGFDLGLGVGGRIALVLGPAAFFIGLTGVGWLVPQRVLVDRLDLAAELPRLEG
ncbi:MAG: hypothetical protein EXR72_14680 [Myxococcales bacterium]|nr:hypothetical protein [Myxococcales bacterium]